MSFGRRRIRQGGGLGHENAVCLRAGLAPFMRETTSSAAHPRPRFFAGLRRGRPMGARVNRNAMSRSRLPIVHIGARQPTVGAP